MQPYLQQCYFAFFRAVPDLSTFANCTPEFMKDSWFKSIYLSNIFIIIAIGKYKLGLHLARHACLFLNFYISLSIACLWGGLDCMERTQLHGADSTA